MAKVIVAFRNFANTPKNETMNANIMEGGIFFIK